MNKRIHEYCRSSRYRIAGLLRNARRNLTNESTTSESDEEVRPPLEQRRRRFLLDEVSGPAPRHDFNDGTNGIDDGNLGSMEASSSEANDDDTDEGNTYVNIENADQGPAGANLDRNVRDDSSSSEGDSSSNDEDSESSSASDIPDEEQDYGNVHDDEWIEQEEGGELPQENDGWDADDDVEIYDGAPINVGESMVAILSFYLRHNITLAALSDSIGLLSLHCKADRNKFPPSLYHFKKFFKNIQFPIIRHYYCSVCFKSLPEATAVCDTHQKGNEFFLQVPVISQLRALYKRPGFREKINYKLNRTKVAENNLEDIYDGAVYCSLSEPGQILSDECNISLMWYTDGVSIFKSSKSEIWPFFLVINELGYNERSKLSNALLAGLWFGRNKPEPATFLKPIKEELLRLKRGINILSAGNPAQNITVKAIVMSGTADIPAKAKFLNFKAHNSAHGCAKCTIQTVNIRRGLNVYPYRENLHLRTHEETVMHAREALGLPFVNGVSGDVLGVKGPSILSTFVYQYVQTLSVDAMHCCFLGIMKSLMSLWFEPRYRDKGYSLSHLKTLVNARLSKISPPSFVQRLTRSLDDIKYWKAHELKTFLFYYSIPVLGDCMSPLYFDHHRLFVLGLFLLSKRSVSEQDVNFASELMSEYVAQFEDLYGLENMTCNLHQLLHLADVVRDFGPLWVTSCFPFEDMNGKLKKLVKGTRYAELQVCSGVSMLMKFAELSNRIPDNRPPSLYVKALFDANGRIKRTSIGHRMAIVGKYVRVLDLQPEIHQALRNANVRGRNFYEFYRFMKYCFLFGSELYGRGVKTQSTCVKFQVGEEMHFGFVNRLLKVTQCDCDHFCDGCEPKYVAIVRKCETQLEFGVFEGAADVPFLHTCGRLGDYFAVELATDLLCMCFVVNIIDREKKVLVEPVNLIEAE